MAPKQVYKMASGYIDKLIELVEKEILAQQHKLIYKGMRNNTVKEIDQLGKIMQELVYLRSGVLTEAMRARSDRAKLWQKEDKEGIPMVGDTFIEDL